MSSVRRWIRKLVRRIGPPGNRAPLDESYRQPNGPDGGNPAPGGRPERGVR